MAQSHDFNLEIVTLTNGKRLSSRSPLLPLRPFLGPDGLLRVGGRLMFARIAEEQKHPLILHRSNPISTLLLRHAHACTLHGGPQLMKSVLNDVWITNVNALARKIQHECVTCTRYRGAPASQLMGALPSERVNPGRPFRSAGVDFAGPFHITARRSRSVTSYKAYIALFVCLSTKAIHLEIVSDLTSMAFVAAFKRFTSRRGHCATLLSDNATNFQGANNELRAMLHSAFTGYRDAAAKFADLGTDWRFIPPAAPHFGGLWEAGVKSVKHHLRRIMGEQIFSHEEMHTLVAQIEACLNSRPLYAMTNSINDFSALTPGHLLVGEPLVSVPEQSYCEYTEQHPLSRWQHVSRMRDHFWRRWSREYLQQLQARPRWRQAKHNVNVGTLVVVHDTLTPPANWLLARVTQVHPGADGLVRVVTLRTANGTLQRPIHKLTPLPIRAENATSKAYANNKRPTNTPV